MGLKEVDSVAEGDAVAKNGAKSSPYQFWGSHENSKRTPKFPSRERHFAIRRKPSSKGPNNFHEIVKMVTE